MNQTEKKMMVARAALVIDQPFFGALALRLKLVEDPSCKTAWVDGRTLGYNAEFIDAQSHNVIVGIIAHEVMHCACGHPWRRDGREQKKWNIACDHAINTMLRESGFKLPKGVLCEAQFTGKASEWIYDRLPRSDGQDGKGTPDENGAPQPDAEQSEPHGTEQEQPGEVRDAPADATEDSNTEPEWREAVQQAAAAARARGALPAGLGRFVKQAVKPRVDWRSALRRFVQQAAQADYAWTRPNTRYLARRLYLPSLRSEQLGAIAVIVDTSGSIDDVTLAKFAAEINAIADELQPARIHVVYADAAVNAAETFEQGEPVELRPMGGGGTDFAPALEAVDTMDEPPVCAVYLTDLAGSFPSEPPALPVLWAVTGTIEAAPFGEVVGIDG
jgi:predicted metal-dependent peptidase